MGSDGDTPLPSATAAFAQSPLWQELGQRLRRFNAIRLLGVERAEVPHSNVLAWLLDPRSAHGVGGTFLELLLRRACPAIPPNAGGRWAVRREWRYIDLLLVNEVARTVVAIENKVDSEEHSDQLGRYFEVVERGFATYSRHYLFLTPEGYPGSRAEWLPISYKDVGACLRSAIDQCPGAPVAESEFARQYLDILEGEFMINSESDRICRQLCEQHPEAVEALVGYWQRTRETVLTACTAEIEAAPDRWRIVHRDSKQVGFVPREWHDITPAICTAARFPKDSWIAFWVWIDQQWAELNLYLGPTTDEPAWNNGRDAARHIAEELGLHQSSRKGTAGDWLLIARDPGFESRWQGPANPEILRERLRISLQRIWDHLPTATQVLRDTFDG